MLKHVNIGLEMSRSLNNRQIDENPKFSFIFVPRTHGHGGNAAVNYDKSLKHSLVETFCSPD